jgi:hypothetical protein
MYKHTKDLNTLRFSTGWMCLESLPLGIEVWVLFSDRTVVNSVWHGNRFGSRKTYVDHLNHEHRDLGHAIAWDHITVPFDYSYRRKGYKWDKTKER